MPLCRWSFARWGTGLARALALMPGLAALTCVAADFDLYLSTSGDDANDGLSSQTAKRTIDGCLAAATNDARVCVLPGDYAPPTNLTPKPSTLSASYDYNLVPPSGNCLSFVAAEGAGTVSVTGVYDGGSDGGHSHTMALSTGPQTFSGFTFRRIGGYSASAASTAVRTTAPAFSCVRLVDCVVEDCDIGFSSAFGAFYSCTFSNTVFRGVVAHPTSLDYSVNCGVYSSCSFFGCRMEDFEFTNGMPYAGTQLSSVKLSFFYGEIHAERSLFSVSAMPAGSMAEAAVHRSSGGSSFAHCTFVWDAPDSGHMRVKPEQCTDCYFCVGTGLAWDGGAGNAFAPAWTNAFLDADFTPASVECPAVRMDIFGTDAGWRDSGLSVKKVVSAYASELMAQATPPIHTVVVTNVIVHVIAPTVPRDAVVPPVDAGIVAVIGEIGAGKGVAIPAEWAKAFPDFEARFGSDFARALTAPTGKRDAAGGEMLVWQDFVAGTDPTDENDVFTASLTFDKTTGEPVVSWSPVLSEEAAAMRVYRTYGKRSLSDPEWREVDGDAADYGFFKVVVEMR